jgi:hypothetical protein
MTKREEKYTHPELREEIKQPGQETGRASGAPASPKSSTSSTRSGAADIPAIRTRA